MQSLEPTESKSYWVKLSAKQRRDRVFFFLVSIVIALALPDLAYFVDPASLAIGVGATLLTAVTLERLHKVPLSVTLLNLAIPMGIVASSIGLVSIFSVYSSSSVSVQAVSAATSIVLLTTFYGLILCVIGYSLSKNDDSYLKLSPIGIRALLLLASFNYGLIFWGMSLSNDPTVFLSIKPLLLAILFLFFRVRLRLLLLTLFSETFLDLQEPLPKNLVK